MAYILQADRANGRYGIQQNITVEVQEFVSIVRLINDSQEKLSATLVITILQPFKNALMTI